MHTKFIQKLAEAGATRDFFKFIVKGAADALSVPKDAKSAVKTTITQSEIKTD